MTPGVAEIVPMEGFGLWVRFEDGKDGILDLTGKLSGPAFEPLMDKTFFDLVSIDAAFGALTWPSGADLAPEYVYEHVL